MKVRTRLVATLVALLVASGCRSAHVGVAADAAFEAELVALMRSGIDVLEPNTSVHLTRGRPTHFDGSYDWHSCVIAHWALSISARVRGDAALEAWLAPRLTREVFDAESALIVGPDSSVRPTWPYDEAWFCLLLAERARMAPGTFGDLRRLHERRLVEALERLPLHVAGTRSRGSHEEAGGERPRRGGREVGSYRSWLWAWVALGWCEPIASDVRERHLALWDERVAPNLDALLAIEEAHGYDFLWVPALAALSAEVRGRNCEYQTPPIDDLPAEVAVATVHPLGVHLSAGWPGAARAARTGGDDSAWLAYTVRRDGLRARRDLWAEDFDACSHWMPQYLFIGEWLAAGRP